MGVEVTGKEGSEMTKDDKLREILERILPRERNVMRELSNLAPINLQIVGFNKGRQACIDAIMRSRELAKALSKGEREELIKQIKKEKIKNA